MQQRQALIKNWLSNSLSFENFSLSQASSDASFRRYFRISLPDKSYIVMDAPPEKESLEPFAGLSLQFRKYGINTPKIYARDDSKGFLLLTDFGSISYLDVLNDKTVDELYQKAIDTIVRLQKIPQGAVKLPPYDEKLLQFEMSLFDNWYLKKYLQADLSKAQSKELQSIFDILETAALAQPKVCVHRDYHSRNLMYIENSKPGVIDFQDAVYGPYTYDLVSLIKDCYIDWPEQKLLKWLGLYKDRLTADGQTNISLEELERQLDFMGVQRHLKAIGIFTRLNLRDGKPAYMNDIPRTLDYVVQMTQKYSELKPLRDFCIFSRDKVVV